MINISTEFTDYGYTFNRSLSSVIELPYTKDEVLLGVNELVNGYNFNSSINKLQSNLMYLYSVSKIAQPSLPKLYEGFIGKATYATQKTEIILKNLTPYSLAVTAHANENLDQMPYFYVEDENNKTNWFVLHAEANAILKTAGSNHNCKDSTLYLTMSPCKECSKLIHQSGIKRVVFINKYKETIKI